MRDHCPERKIWHWQRTAEKSERGAGRSERQGAGDHDPTGKPEARAAAEGGSLDAQPDAGGHGVGAAYPDGQRPGKVAQRVENAGSRGQRGHTGVAGVRHCLCPGAGVWCGAAEPPARRSAGELPAAEPVGAGGRCGRGHGVVPAVVHQRVQD
ncbi:MAG: hypothetical protein DBY41_05725 [Clostridium sp.]|nr:MAG: hypothetical protein DBY41_05725 [Clostridium sp.]